jgi:hypothetical protein
MMGWIQGVCFRICRKPRLKWPHILGLALPPTRPLGEESTRGGCCCCCRGVLTSFTGCQLGPAIETPKDRQNRRPEETQAPAQPRGGKRCIVLDVPALGSPTVVLSGCHRWARKVSLASQGESVAGPVPPPGRSPSRRGLTTTGEWQAKGATREVHWLSGTVLANAVWRRWVEGDEDWAWLEQTVSTQQVDKAQSRRRTAAAGAAPRPMKKRCVGPWGHRIERPTGTQCLLVSPPPGLSPFFDVSLAALAVRWAGMGVCRPWRPRRWWRGS